MANILKPGLIRSEEGKKKISSQATTKENNNCSLENCCHVSEKVAIPGNLDV